MLTPADIENKRFGTTRFKEGYDPEEVDSFLDDAHAAMVVLQRALDDAERRAAALQSQVQRLTEAPTTSVQAVSSPSAVAEKLLAAAQTAAEQHEAEAKEAAAKHVADGRADADRMINDAGAKSARMIEEATAAANAITDSAKAEAERIKNDGYAEKYRLFQELEVRHNTMSTAVNELENRGRSIREALAEAMNRYDSRAGGNG